MSTPGNQGGTHEQHVKAGQESHKDTPKRADTDTKADAKPEEGKQTQGGTHEQHVKAGQQSHKNS